MISSNIARYFAIGTYTYIYIYVCIYIYIYIYIYFICHHTYHSSKWLKWNTKEINLIMNFQNILLPNIYFPNNYFQVIRTLVNEKQYICSASLGGYVHLTSNQLHSINKDELPKPVLLRTLLLKMHHFKWMFVENKFIRSLGVICSI